MTLFGGNLRVYFHLRNTLLLLLNYYWESHSDIESDVVLDVFQGSPWWDGDREHEPRGHLQLHQADDGRHSEPELPQQARELWSGQKEAGVYLPGQRDPGSPER